MNRFIKNIKITVGKTGLNKTVDMRVSHSAEKAWSNNIIPAMKDILTENGFMGSLNSCSVQMDHDVLFSKHTGKHIKGKYSIRSSRGKKIAKGSFNATLGYPLKFDDGGLLSVKGVIKEVYLNMNTKHVREVISNCFGKL